MFLPSLCFYPSILVISKGKIQNFMFFLFLYNCMALENQGTIKELLVLQFADLRSTNKELLEVGLEVGSF